MPILAFECRWAVHWVRLDGRDALPSMNLTCDIVISAEFTFNRINFERDRDKWVWQLCTETLLWGVRLCDVESKNQNKKKSPIAVDCTQQNEFNIN